MIVSLENIDEVIEQHYDYALKTLLEQGQLPFVFTLVDKQGRTLPILGAMPDNDLKAMVYDFVRLNAIAHNAVAIIEVIESWIVFGEIEPGLTPSQSNNRREVVLVIVALQDPGGGELLGKNEMREIIRDEDGEVISLEHLGPEGQAAISDLKGPIADLLPKREASLRERRDARAAIDKLRKQMKRQTMH